MNLYPYIAALADLTYVGPEDPARALLLSAGAFSDRLQDQIWVFNQGFWQKDHGLWQEVQKADWKDVILKEEFKKALQKDIYGFFASEEIYKQLAIPWKVSITYLQKNRPYRCDYTAWFDHVRTPRKRQNYQPEDNHENLRRRRFRTPLCQVIPKYSVDVLILSQ